MKNIFLLPTDKPSKLFIDVDNNKLTITDKPMGGEHFMNQNLYITSDEAVEDGDFYLYLKDNSVHKFIKKYHTKLQSPKIQKKIILTIDENLVKDGVQAIDDEFLEWFVKNSSCEEVEIGNDQYKILNSEWKNFYKIIIPKEEPTQETLEEASEKRYSFGDGFQIMDIDISETLQLAFINGAKWKAERSYSEEEVEDLIYKICGTVARLQGIILNGNHINTAYKQFKKK